MTKPTMAHDGFSNGAKPLTEGYLRKGGINPPVKADFVRPAPPAPMRAAESQPAPPAASQPPRR